MRFKQFLESESQSRLKNILPLYEKNIKILLNKDRCLYRGMRGMASLLATDTFTDLDYGQFSAKTDRSSLTNSNILLSITQGWDVPNRTRSAFATTSKGYASSTFGAPYVIIPRDDVKEFAYTPYDLNRVNAIPSRSKVMDLLDISADVLNVVRRLARSVPNGQYDESRNIINKIIDDAGVGYIIRVPEALRGIYQRGKLEDYPKVWKVLDKIRESKALKSAMKAESALEDVELLSSLLIKFDQVYPEKMVDISKHISAEAFDVTVHKSLQEISFSENDDELWWEGHFLIVSSPFRKGEELIKLNELLKSTH